MSGYDNPTIPEFKTFFNRDFPYGTDIESEVTDQDIAKAYQVNYVQINPELFISQEIYTLGFLYLAAHNLVTNLRASSQGMNGQFNFLESGKSVGSVSQSFAIPDLVQNNPYWSVYYKTNYGAQYMELILPYLTGTATMIARGSTRP